jgi:hypothetical protein
MDFLGLSNLTIIKNALRIIKKVYGDDIDINTIPLDDAKTYTLLSSGDTTGVFQLESAGMKRYLKELQPSVFEDIISMVALYRPGPMQWIEDFIARNHVKAEATEKHQAQVEVYHEDVVVGYWKTVKYSGAVPRSRVRELVERVEKLQKAVKMSREEANSVSAEKVQTSDKVFGYLFAAASV